MINKDTEQFAIPYVIISSLHLPSNLAFFAQVLCSFSATISCPNVLTSASNKNNQGGRPYWTLQSTSQTLSRQIFGSHVTQLKSFWIQQHHKKIFQILSPRLLPASFGRSYSKQLVYPILRKQSAKTRLEPDCLGSMGLVTFPLRYSGWELWHLTRHCSRFVSCTVLRL